ncbi:PIN domain-containing protein [Winogradskya humida]|uniref:PIN domain-containing protein n=1 Tax=Winogradskya humida TaxID=113566 RepID=A0ABQ4A668_9ACTN|nr:PIN domain-containing protein [Actinoplanes humidus]GIE26346.1 hypothetical protein Ahu01nite_094480 [Actinoplanes humidus]
MLVTPTLGANLLHVISLLDRCRSEPDNYSGDPIRYVRWVFEMARMFRGQIRTSDVDRLLFTPGFTRLLSLLPGAAATLQQTERPGVFMEAGGQVTPWARDALAVEIADRKDAYEAAHAALRKEFVRWGSNGEVFVVVDTSVFIKHPMKIEDIPWAEEIGQGFEEIRVVVPYAVIKELDRLKEHSQPQVRWRAGLTLAVVDRLLRNPDGRTVLRPADPNPHEMADRGEMPRGTVTIEVLYDNEMHVPLHNDDAEIIDRALAVQVMSGEKVRLLTMDTGMGLEASRHGLKVHKPARDPEPDPADQPPSRRAARRAKADERAAADETNSDQGPPDGS